MVELIISNKPERSFSGDTMQSVWSLPAAFSFRNYTAALFISMLTLFAACSNLYAAGGDILWQRSNALTGKQQALTSVKDKTGNIIIAGFKNTTGGVDDDYWVEKYKADGSGLAWSYSYNASGGSDLAVSVTTDLADNVIVTGTVWNGLNKDIYTVKLDAAAGSVLWAKNFNGVSNGNDAATTVTVDELDNVYVSGYQQGSGGDDDGLILKYSTDGVQLWANSYQGTALGNDQLFAVDASGGNVVATGQSWNGSAFDFVTVSYKSDGTFNWVKRFTAPAGSSQGAGGRYLVISSLGKIHVTGFTSNSIDKDIYTAVYDTGGSLLWERIYNGAFDDEPSGIALSETGDVFITGYRWTLSGNNDFYTARYAAADGALVWEKGFDSGGGNTDVAIPTGIDLDPQGDVYVTGYTVTGTNYDFQTIRYRQDNGTQLWHSSFNGIQSLNDRPVGIFVSPSGSILVPGWTQVSTDDIDTILLSYDSGALNAPTEQTASATSSTTVSLSWNDNSSNEDGFKIERKTGELGTFAEIATVGAGVVTYSDNALNPDTYYYYRVRAYNAVDGNSHYSDVAHALTVYAPAIAADWAYRYNSPDNLDDFAAAVATGSDNNPVVTGYSLRNTGGFDYYTFKLDRSSASVLWSDLYDSVDSELDKATCVAIDSLNNPIVSGFSSLYYDPAQSNINSIYTIKYTPNGAPASWSAQYNGPGGIDDRAVAIATATDAENNVYVLGYGKNASNNEDIYLVKYSSTGSKLWSAVPFDGGGVDLPSSLAVAADGSVFITGMSERISDGKYNIFVAKFSGSNGSIIWSDSYSSAAGGDNRGRGIQVDASGHLFVTGFSTNIAGNRDFATLMYDANASSASRLWEKFYDAGVNGDDEAVSIQLDQIDGNIVVAGHVTSYAGNHDLALVKYDAAGNLVWSKTLLRPASDDTLNAMVIDSSGYIYAAGSSITDLKADAITAILDFEGNVLGVTTYNGPDNSNDEALSIAVNHKGEAFAAGYSESSDGTSDYLVFKITNPFILAPSPFNLTANQNSTSVGVSWGINSLSTTYRLERTLSPIDGGSFWTLMQESDTSTSSFTDTGLNPGAGYCYRIWAYNQNVASRKTVKCVTTTLGAPVLNTVAAISATAADLSWNNISGNTGYVLERRDGSGSWIQAGGALPANTVIYHDSTLTAGKVYSYRLKVMNPGGVSMPSQIEYLPVLKPLSAVTSNSINITWDAVPESTGYIIEKSIDGSTWQQLTTLSSSTLIYTDSLLNPASIYYYRLKTDASGRVSAPGLTVSALTILATPEITGVTPETTTSLTVNWSDPNSAETGVTLEYSRCTWGSYVNCTPYLENDAYWYAWETASLPANSVYQLINLPSAYYPYRIRVKATLSGGDSQYSNKIIATPRFTAGDVLTVTPLTQSSIQLDWIVNALSSGSNILMNGSLMTAPDLPLSNSTRYTVSGLQSDNTYCFAIRLFNPFTYSDTTQKCATLVSPPAISSLTPQQSAVTVTWSDVPNDNGYEIYYTTALNWYQLPASVDDTARWQTSGIKVSVPANSTGYTISSLYAGFAYKFKIRYKLADGSFSPYSSEIMTVTLPEIPTNINIQYNSTTQLYFTPSTVGNGLSYDRQFVLSPEQTSCANVDWVPVPIENSTTPSYTANGLTSGAPYCFRIRSNGTSGSSPWSNPVLAVTILAPPILNTATDVTMSTLSLSWSQVAGNYGYKVERHSQWASGVDWQLISTVATGVTSFTDSTVSPAFQYDYRIKTLNSNAIPSLYSNLITVTTLAVTPPVVSALDSITTNQVRVVWSDIPGSSGFRVERSYSGSLWETVATVSAGVTSYADSTVTPGTLYYYRVFTLISSGGASVASNMLSATTTPSAPFFSYLTPVSQERIDLNWSVVKGSTNYKILRSIGAAGPWVEITNQFSSYYALYCGKYSLPSVGCPSMIPVTASYINSGLQADTEYCYQITAWNATGGDSAISPVVCANTLTMNGPVLNSVTPLGGMKISLDWSYDPSSCTPSPCVDAENFEVWKQLVTGGWGLVSVAGNTNSYIDIQGIEPLKTYSYKIRAKNGGNYSPFSGAKSADTPAFTTADGVCP